MHYAQPSKGHYGGKAITYGASLWNTDKMLHWLLPCISFTYELSRSGVPITRPRHRVGDHLSLTCTQLRLFFSFSAPSSSSSSTSSSYSSLPLSFSLLPPPHTSILNVFLPDFIQSYLNSLFFSIFFSSYKLRA